MSNKARSIIKATAVILVLLMVLMHLGWLVIPVVVPYKFWIVVIAFGLLLIGGK
jgi:hypothetical protein